jgi:hypothetical protein
MSLSKKLKEDYSYRPDVNFRSVRLYFEDFRGHISESTYMLGQYIVLYSISQILPDTSEVTNFKKIDNFLLVLNEDIIRL